MTNTKNVKKGDKIRVLYMSGEPKYNGKIGIVEHIDDAGQIWFGYGCAIIPTLDKFEIINKEEEKWKTFIIMQTRVV